MRPPPRPATVTRLLGVIIHAPAIAPVTAITPITSADRFIVRRGTIAAESRAYQRRGPCAGLALPTARRREA